MEKIINKAIEGGWEGVYLEKYEMFFLDPLFWQALGKSCKWKEPSHGCDECGRSDDRSYKDYALDFHEINLNEGWYKAVIWLEGLVK